MFAGDMNGKIYEVDMEHESLRELFVMDRETGYIGFCGDVLIAVGYPAPPAASPPSR